MTAAWLGKLRRTPGHCPNRMENCGWGHICKCIWQRKIYRHLTELLECLEGNKDIHKENQANELNGSNY